MDFPANFEFLFECIVQETKPKNEDSKSAEKAINTEN